ncbi:MAG: prepilin-type N-terminal cleavage/methylation domain-containing protein [Magnetococcales bacterium]|nr:prepilin-type N-terminal cleavage/methylation domain-containing protein [Magnetococcales bacterium]
MVKRTNRGFTLVELMVVMIIIGVLASLSIGPISSYILAGRLAQAKPYLMAIAAKERIYQTQRGVWKAAADEQDLVNDLGVSLKDAADFCFMVRTNAEGFISSSANTTGFEVWAVLRNSGGANATVSVYDSGASCTSADQKNDATGWVKADSDEKGGEGRVVVLRYPPPATDLDSTTRSGRADITLDWVDGISTTDAML